MRTPDSGYISSILVSADNPCVSIYLPTHRVSGNGHGSGGLNPQHNVAQFRSLADRAEQILAKSHPAAARGIAEKLHALHGDADFWSHVGDGVAVLASPERFDSFTLPRKMPESVTVGETFHVKPLLRFVQSAEPFHVLGVSRERVALFHGDRYHLRPLNVPGIPLTIAESLGPRSAEPTPGLHAAGPDSTTRSNARVGGQDSHGHPVGHGLTVRKVETHPEAERFYREVDHEVVRRVSEPTGLPLILAGIDDNLSEFRGLSKNRFLAAEGVHGDWTKLSLHEIREKAWKVFEKHYLDRLARIREDYGTASAHRQGTDRLEEAAKAAAGGRVGILLIDDDRTLPGHIDASGTPHPGGGGDGTGDMLDDLAELALRTKAQVIVTPSSQMPTKTGLAAIFGY
jgi:hypothetical protein